MAMDVVDYEIKGAEMQFVEVELDPGEAAVGEAGSMMFMDAGIEMDTVFDDGSQGSAFAAPYPGKILAMDLRQLGGMLICQKDAFLCAARGVTLGIFFQRKLLVGFFAVRASSCKGSMARGWPSCMLVARS
jgi:uncharacterized protein (AIM24 family)